MTHDETLPFTDSVFVYAPVVRPFDPEETWADRMDDFPWSLWEQGPEALRLIGDGPVHASVRITTEHRELLQGPIMGLSLPRAQVLLGLGLAVAERIEQGLIVFDCEDQPYERWLTKRQAGSEPSVEPYCFSVDLMMRLQELAQALGEVDVTCFDCLGVAMSTLPETWQAFQATTLQAESKARKGAFDRLNHHLKTQREFLGPGITINELVRPGAQVNPQTEPSSRPAWAFRADSRDRLKSVLEMAAQVKDGLENDQPPDPFIVRNQLKRAIISALRFEEHPDILTSDLNLCMEVRRQCRSTIIDAATWLDLPPQPLFDDIEKAESLAWDHFVSKANRAKSNRKRELASMRGRSEQEGSVESNAVVVETPSHSEDFTSVDWFGTRYTFSKGNQAQTVRALWEAWEAGEHSLTQETIGDRIGSVADRFEVRKTFLQRNRGQSKSHPAWGTMIQQSSKGCFRLVPPES